jgi:ribonuclease HI
MINVDGAFDETKGPRGSAAVIRDTGGAFIAAARSFIPHVLDALSAEAAALRDGLLLAQQIGCNCVEIQSDCMEVVQTMHDGGFSATAVGHSTMRSSGYGRNLVRYLLVIVIDLVTQ